MANELSKLNLDDDFEAVLACPDAARWKLERGEALEVLATVSPASHPKEFFQVRFVWSRYPEDPPSMKFRDPTTGSLEMPSSWPMLPGFRPASRDACVSWCLEGFNLHPEWRNDPQYRWDPRGNVLLKVLRILQAQLDDHYQGRAK